VTPLEKAAQLIDEIDDYACDIGVDLPKLRYPQIGTPVIGCEAFTIGVIDVTPHEQYGPVECNASQLVTFSVNVSRTCSWVADDDGIDDPEKVAEVSATLSADSEVLWSFAQQYRAYLSKQWNVTFLRTGGLGITTMSFIIGVD
jgi:hypothetical protein